MRRSIIPVLLVALGMSAGTAVSAHEFLPGSWPTNSHTVYLNGWAQIFMGDHRDALLDAAAKVNSNPSNMRFTLADEDDASLLPNNGESEADFVDAVPICGSIACNIVWIAGGNIVETDVYFDVFYDWTLTDSKVDSEAYDSTMFRPLVNTGVHEFSHSIGMDHENDLYQIMGDAKTVVNTNGSSTETVISADTSEGLVVQYGLRASALEDLSLYHWEWSGSSGAYSTHARTPLKSAAGVPLVPLAGVGEPRYSIAAGTTIKVRQTAENRGRNTQNVTIKWYVSTNDLITTGDTLLATSAINIARAFPFTWDRTVTLPNNLISGEDYWVGAIIDSGGVLAENNEFNNAIYVAEIEIP